MEWIAFSDRKPENYSRVLVHRVIGKNQYVDVISYIEEPKSGMPPLCDFRYIVHWMPMPGPPPKPVATHQK